MTTRIPPRASVPPGTATTRVESRDDGPQASGEPEVQSASPTTGPWATAAGTTHPTAWARALMQQMESDPDSALNVKLRSAGIDKPVDKFSDTLGVIAEPWKMKNVTTEQLQNAIRAAVEFAVDHYVAAGGRRNQFFKTIEIAPERAEGLGDAIRHNDQLSMKPGGSLVVEIKNPKNGGRAISPEKIHEQWNKGYQFADKKLRKAWPLLNPMGEIRSTLRGVAGDAATKLGLDLSRLKERIAQGEPNARGELQAFAERIIGPSVKSSSDIPMRDALKAKIDSSSSEELASMVGDWHAKVTSAAFQDDVLGQVVNIAAEDQPNIRSKAIGLIAISNVHDINVNLDISQGATSVRRFLAPSPSPRRDLESTSIGLLAIATQDRINVSATIDNLRKPAAAAVVAEGLAQAFGL